MRNIAQVLIVGTATTLAMAGVPAAHAGGDMITGGCYDHTVVDPILTNGIHEGVIGDSSVTQDSSGPVFATVVCNIHVNGLVTPFGPYYYAGTGTQAGSSYLQYSAGPGDVVELCQDVFFADGFETGVTCQPA
ncbi:MAG: hypothetical protein JO079_14215 [Frankiaceae bacterium]|nr:hypothetical protein [Frankiaceae bacterium]